MNDVRDLTNPVLKELEMFFIATEELEDKKLDIIGWEGPDAALDAVKAAAKASVKSNAK